ncbi:hypothetical protein LMG19087_04532 [Ralstonia wenshanensis]|nr:hypothetical protein LMG19087_04532 [Ralstonia wenshanensis]
MGAFASTEESAVETLLTATKGYRASLANLDALVESGASIETRDKGVAGADKPIGQALDALINIGMERTRKRGETVNHLAQIAEQLTSPASSKVLHSRRTFLRSMPPWRLPARGGQSRGFAVVAGEVRALAQRSATAAKEIKDLMAASVSKVEDGARLASEAGATMSEVTSAIARVTGIMSEIAEASVERSRGIEQINLAIAQMDEMTQQNAALVKQAASAPASLEDHGRQLRDAVAFFRLDISGQMIAAPVRTA